jgi:hypothetical protein
MLLGLFTLITVFLFEGKGEKGKLLLQPLLARRSRRRAKVLTRRLKPVGTAYVPKLIESAEAAPLATETAPAVPIEASVGPIKELESKRQQNSQRC